jgi:uncharacterized cupredoxin-like copper-binding protein
MRAAVVAAIGVLLLMPMSAARSQSAVAVDWSAAQSVNIMLIDNKFVPEHIILRHGVPYQLHLENHGHDLHEFTAPELFGASILRNLGQLANDAQEIVMHPGDIIEVELMPLKPGTYRLICADHDWDGMVGEIAVE